MFFRRKILAGLAALTLCTTAMAADWKPESLDPIKLTINEWNGQILHTHIVGEILKRMGYNVQLVVAGYFPQLIAMQDGSVSFALEIATTNIGDALKKALATGKVIDIGDEGPIARETWYYPAYMEEQCPGLPDWKALKNCAAVFATTDTMPMGRLLDYPADWGTTNPLRIKALDLPFVAIPAGSDGALLSELKVAVANKTPLLMMWYRPSWTHLAYDLREVKLPPYEEGCFDDPAVGINPHATYDCDFIKGEIRKVAWKGMQTKWPAALKLLTELHFEDKDYVENLRRTDIEGESMDKVVADWMTTHESVWKAWIADSTKP